MRKLGTIGLIAAVVALTSSIGLALRFNYDRGAWPASWPKELEQFRQRAETEYRSGGSEEMVHQILFQTREEFEQAWPHILKVKTPGAPLMLETTGSAYKGQFKSMGVGGVQIRSPAPPGRGFSEETRNRSAEWPDYLKLPGGGFPEYVVHQDGKWVSADPTDFNIGLGIYYRIRTDIVLIVDGKVVDLNRIQLPGDTPIIDNRFGKQ